MSSQRQCPVDFADPANAPEGEFRLPPSSADLDADYRACRDAGYATTNADQWAAVMERAQSLRARTHAAGRARRATAG